MSIVDSETAAQAAVVQTSEIIARWKAFAIDQHIIDIANRFLSPTDANAMIQSVRTGLVALDMDNALAALTATLGKI
jgi:hypothetical protein